MNYSRVVLVTSALGLFSCGTADDSSTETALLQCDELSVEQCLDGPDCAYLNGREIHDIDTEPCVDFSQDTVAKGCIANGMGCGAAETSAAPSGDPSDCWWFSSTCVPTGWVACDASLKLGECDS